MARGFSQNRESLTSNNNNINNNQSENHINSNSTTSSITATSTINELESLPPPIDQRRRDTEIIFTGQTSQLGEATSNLNNFDSPSPSTSSSTSSPSSSSSFGGIFPSFSTMPTTRGNPSLGETQAVARQLFHQFTHEKFALEGIEEPPNYDVEEEHLQFREAYDPNILSSGYNHTVLASVGRDLRKISESFARSKERQEVKRKAQSVNVTDLTSQNFRLLLNELFQNGVSRERIVVLFFFCTDVALRAVTNAGVSISARLLSWSLDFIFERVCAWVQSQGGWEVVLSSYVPRLALTVCCFVGTIAFFVYIRNNWAGPRST